MTLEKRTGRTLVALVAVLTAGLLGACSPAPASNQASAGAETTQATLIASPLATSNGLVVALHSRCNVGDKILHYLATGDNQGDPQLDTILSHYVGVPLPQARSIADQQIQLCDANLSKAEAAQASAQASAADAQTRAANAAQATAQADQDKAARKAAEEKACAKLGGNVLDGGFFSDSCVPTRTSTSDGSTSCRYAQIPFHDDGTLSSSDIADFKSGYPGCFP